MKPLLEQKVKNETETVFFINEIYKRQDNQFKKCINELSNYIKYFPADSELPLPDKSIGAYVEERIELLHPGTNQSTKRGIYYHIKMVFKKQYYKNLEFPELPEKDLRPEIFWKMNKDLFNSKYVITDNADAVAEYVFHSLRSTFTDIQWIDYGYEKSEIKFIDKSLEILSINVPDNDIYAVDCLRLLLESKKTILVIENLSLLEYRNDLQNEITKFLKVSPDSQSQVILLHTKSVETGRVTEGKNNISMQGLTNASQTHYREQHLFPKIPYKYLYAVIIILSVFVGFIAIGRGFGIQPEGGPVIELRYYSDLIPQDEFEAGVVFSWYNKSGVELHTDNNGYNPNFVLNSIPQSASFVVLSSGSYEIYPDTLQVEMLKGDTLRCVAYREIRFGDVVNGEIKAYGAQRWYSIVLPEPGTIQISCIALEKRISPQVAVFTDRIGKHRVIPSNNTTGTVETDKISAVLPAGKYYVKVRGYDKSIGLFQLKAEKLPDM